MIFITMIPWWRSIVFILAGVITIFACTRYSNIGTASEAGVIMQLPNSVGNLWGVDQPVSESEKVILPPDTEFAKKIYGFGDDKIQCQIVLAGAEKRSIHRPEICLPGQGWSIKSGDVINVPLKNGHSLPVMKLTMTRTVQVSQTTHKELTALFLYWFVGKDSTTPYHWERILKTSWDRVVHKTNHRWAYVIVSAPVLAGFTPDGKDTKQTLEMLTNFIHEAAPEFMTISNKD